MKKMRSSLLALLVLFGASTATWAQSTSDTTATKEVDIKYVPKVVEDAQKLSIPLTKFPINVKPQSFSYNFTPELFQVNTYYREPLQPITLGQLEQQSLNRWYGIAGFGNYRNALLDLHYGSTQHETWRYSARAKHRSGTGPLEFSNFGQSLVELSGEKTFAKHTLTGSAKFEQRRAHLFGIDTNITTLPETPDSLRRDFFYYGGKFTYDNFRSNDAPIHYSTRAEGYYFVDNEGIYEWDLRFDAIIKEHLQNGDDLEFNATYDYSSYGDSSEKLNRNLVFFNAAYLHENDRLQAKGGIKAATDNGKPVIPDSITADYTTFHLYPDLYAQYKIINDYVIGFAEITGGIIKNDYARFVGQNQWINPRFSLQNTNQKLRIAGGLKGSLSSSLQFNINAGYENYNAFQVFANNDSAVQRFQPVYTGENSSLVSVNAALQYRQHERWLVNLSGTYRSFNFYTFPALHIPTLEGHLKASYRFQDKFTFKGEIYAFNSRTAMTDERRDTTTLNGAVDLSLGADYHFNDKFTAFLSFNNMLNQQYMIWNRYPVQGFQAWIGLKFAL